MSDWIQWATSLVGEEELSNFPLLNEIEHENEIRSDLLLQRISVTVK